MIPGLTRPQQLRPRTGAPSVPADVAPTDIVFSASTVPYDAAEDDVLCTLSAPGATLPVTYSIVGGDDAALVYVDGNEIKAASAWTETPDDVLDIDVRATNSAGSFDETWAPTVIDPEAAVEVWQVAIRDDSGTSRTNVPVVFRVPLPTGSSGVSATPFPSAGNTLIADIGGTPLPLQVSSRTVAADGTWTGATVAAVLPSLGAGATATISVSVQAGSDASGTGITWDDVKSAGWNAPLTAEVSSTVYTADPTTADASDTAYSAANPHYRGVFFDGPICTCHVLSVPFDNAGSRPSDYLRAQYHVYAFKAGSGAVSGGNPIIEVLTDRIIENSAFDPAAWGDVSITTLVAKDAAGGTISSWSSVTAWAGTASDLESEYWWRPGAGAAGQRTAIHETSSGRLQRLIDYGWLLPTPVTAALVSSANSSYASTLSGQSSKPFERQGVHVNSQGETGSRPEIGYLHRVENYAAISYDDVSRENIRLNATGAMKIPWRYRNQNTGLMLDWTATQASKTTSDRTLPSPRANSILWTAGAGGGMDIAHQPMDGVVQFLLSGRLKFLELAHFSTQFCWLSDVFGSGMLKRLTNNQQARGSAWGVRDVATICAITPNDLPASIGLWEREHAQQWLDDSMGTADNVESFGSYHGAKLRYWGTDGGGGVSLSGNFNNTDPTNHRYLQSGALIAVFQEYYYIAAMSHAWRLNTLTSDGVAFLDWMLEILPRRMDAGTPGFSDQMIDNYFGPYMNVNGQTPKTVVMAWRDALSATEAQATWSSRPNLAPGNSSPSSTTFGITSYDVDATNPAAVTIRFNGESAIPLFDDGEDGDWFLGTGAYAGRGGALWCAAAAGFNANGRIIAVDLDGKGCTIDTTVTGGVTPTSGTGRASSGLRLPFAGPNSPWFTSQWWPNNGSNDYTTAALSALNFLKMRNPSRANLDDYRAYVYDRAVNYRSNAISEPLSSGDADLWQLYGDIADLVGV